MSYVVQGIIFWTIIGTITGVVSGWMNARATIKVRNGEFAHAGLAPIRYVIGAALGVAVALLIFREYFGGIHWLPVLFLSWAPSEVLLRNYLLDRHDRKR